MNAAWRVKLTGWWSTPVTRALLALLLMIAIGGVFNADGAFYRWSSVAAVIERTGADGYVTGSTGERIPVEKSVAQTIRSFKMLDGDGA